VVAISNTLADGIHGTVPARSFPVNAYGLYSLGENVWEWSNELFRIRSLIKAAKQRNTEVKTPGTHPKRWFVPVLYIDLLTLPNNSQIRP
jgi:formylglycine-generating enzyme required for sulfatase activity